MRPTTSSIALAVAALLVSYQASAQQPRVPLDHSVYDSWNRIQNRALSNDGRWILYRLTPGLGDAELMVQSLRSEQGYSIARGKSPEFSDDSRYVAFLIAPQDSLVKALKLEDTKPDDLPKDSLGILDLATGDIFRTERVTSFAMPEEAAGWVAYLLEKPKKEPSDSTAEQNDGLSLSSMQEEEDEKKKEEGTELVLRNLTSGESQHHEYVTEYVVADNGQRMAYTVSTKDGDSDGVFVVELSDLSVGAVAGGEGVYKGIAFDDAGEQLAFLSNSGDYEADQPEFTLSLWRAGSEGGTTIADASTSGIPAGWWVSENGELSFSENGSRLFFGTAPRPEPEPEEETPEWEKVELDIWHWQDPLLQPMQLVQRENELKRTYRAVAHLADARVVQLATKAIPTVTVGEHGDADVALAVSNVPYQQEISWDSPRYNDVYVVDPATGNARQVLEGIRGGAQLSPGARYVTWWDREELAWYALALDGGEPVNLTSGVSYPFYNELHDWPYLPDPYGNAGWTEDDGAFLVYDKHDIWATDPTGRAAPRNVTEGVGRSEGLRFRYLRLDPEQDAIPENENILLSAFNLETKDAGYYRDRIRGTGSPRQLAMMPRRFDRPTKAEDADVLTFTRQSFQEFPDLWVSDLSLDAMRKVSDANPQQPDYLWGTSELYEWRSTDGPMRRGIVYKPENFDPSRRYPMMVYFYEKMSDQLHAHRAPAPGSSSINISFYVSRGYVVFVPDVHYRVGYPGESALNHVVPGVLSLIAEGFVDPERVGVQGHSWGGYQIAYLVTRSNVFAAAEAGAPVSNMTSAYGGIRWGTGMSRMFQYEKTQTRIGGTLWNARQRYIENSPLFWADKIETPLLMMHNDKDTAVPWYQGIELFVALRRLGKPTWLLNYNGEPHGLRKYQNRIDWTMRMQQFFDHYLIDAPAPRWLVDGVPAVAKGTVDGLELVEVEPTTSGGSGR